MTFNPAIGGNSTTGLSVAAYVVLSGTGLTNPSGGSLGNPGSTGGNGQGVGATEGGSGSVSTAPGYPQAQYALTLSLSSSGGYSNSATLTAALVDVENNSVSDTGAINFTAKSYNNPSAGSPSWYRPSNFGSYSADVASAVASSTDDATITITSINVGNAIVEVAFPTFGLNDSSVPAGETDYDNDKIYVLVNVTVIP